MDEEHTITWPRMVQLIRLQSYTEFLLAELDAEAIKRAAGGNAERKMRLTVNVEGIRDALHCLGQAEARHDAQIAAARMEAQPHA